MITTAGVSHSDDARDREVMRALFVSGNIGDAPVLIRAAETFASFVFHQLVNGSQHRSSAKRSTVLLRLATKLGVAGCAMVQRTATEAITGDFTRRHSVQQRISQFVLFKVCECLKPGVW